MSYNKKNASKLLSKFIFKRKTKNLFLIWLANAKKLSFILDNYDKMFKAKVFEFQKKKAAKTIQRFVRKIQHEHWLLSQSSKNKDSSNVVEVRLRNPNSGSQFILF